MINVPFKKIKGDLGMVINRSNEEVYPQYFLCSLSHFKQSRVKRQMIKHGSLINFNFDCKRFNMQCTFINDCTVQQHLVYYYYCVCNCDIIRWIR